MELSLGVDKFTAPEKIYSEIFNKLKIEKYTKLTLESL